MGIEALRVVLIETAHPGNLGACARAMKTMGLQRLFLVQPQCEVSDVARNRAVGAVDILDAAEVVDTLAEAVRDCTQVVGASARTRELPLPILDARETGLQLAREAREGGPAAVLFGPEAAGLSNDCLDHCTHQLRIPTSAFKSLNLAQAVQIVCYEIRMAALLDAPAEEDPAEPSAPLDRYPTHAEMEYFYQKLETGLEARDFFRPHGRQATVGKLRRIFARARPRLRELRMLHSVVNLLDRE